MACDTLSTISSSLSLSSCPSSPGDGTSCPRASNAASRLLIRFFKDWTNCLEAGFRPSSSSPHLHSSYITQSQFINGKICDLPYSEDDVHCTAGMSGSSAADQCILLFYTVSDVHKSETHRFRQLRQAFPTLALLLLLGPAAASVESVVSMIGLEKEMKDRLTTRVKARQKLEE